MTIENIIQSLTYQMYVRTRERAPEIAVRTYVKAFGGVSQVALMEFAYQRSKKSKKTLR